MNDIAAPPRRHRLSRLLVSALLAVTALIGWTAAGAEPALAAPTLAARVDAFVAHHPAATKVGNGQCVTLVHAYNAEVLGWKETGTPGDTGAHEWWDSFSKKAGLSAHYTKVAKTSAAKKGDLAVYSKAVGHGYGHIAVVLTDNGSSLSVIQQNWTRSLTVSVDAKMTKGSLLGYLRPKG